MNDNKSKTFILAAVLAAMTTALTFFAQIRIGDGYIHAGDSIIYLSACILPAPYALVSAAIGGALSDALSGCGLYIVPTIIIKALITLPYTSKESKILTKRNALMVIPAGFITVAGYFLTDLLLFDRFVAYEYSLGNTAQAAGSALLFIMMAAALDKLNFKRWFC